MTFGAFVLIGFLVGLIVDKPLEGLFWGFVIGLLFSCLATSY